MLISYYTVLLHEHLTEKFSVHLVLLVIANKEDNDQDQLPSVASDQGDDAVKSLDCPLLSHLL